MRNSHDSGIGGEITLRVAHSPDADDRFMFWPLKAGLLPAGPFRFEWREADTQALNSLASLPEGEAPEVCAISVFHYSNVCDRYQPLVMGCSVGDSYGPVVVARKGAFGALRERNGGTPLETIGNELPGTFAEEGALLLTPGPQTTAHNVTRLLGFEGCATEHVPIVPIERVFDRLAALEREGRPALALLIHEGRLLFEDYGCERVLDIGKAWHGRTGGSLPLGMNVVSRHLPQRMRERLSAVFVESCTYAQAHREVFLDAAARSDSPFHTPLPRGKLTHYLDLYANDTTRRVSAADARSFERLFEEAMALGVLPSGRTIPCDWI